MSTRERFIAGLVQHMGCELDILGRPGVTVSPSEQRAENHVTAAYRIGQHLVVTCDPAATELLNAGIGHFDPTLQGWTDWAAAQDAELLGSARMQTLPSAELAPVALPGGYCIEQLSADDATHVARIAKFIDACSADDVDEIDLAVDDLDPTIKVVIDEAGEIATYCCARPWDDVKGFDDIGVLTRADQRKLDLGKAAVVAACAQMRERGVEPLYRCDEDNVGSIRLSTSLGFELATQLVAFRFAT